MGGYKAEAPKLATQWPESSRAMYHASGMPARFVLHPVSGFLGGLYRRGGRLQGLRTGGVEGFEGFGVGAGALMIRIGFWGYMIILLGTFRNPQHSIGSYFQAPIVG